MTNKQERLMVEIISWIITIVIILIITLWHQKKEQQYYLINIQKNIIDS